MEDDSESIWSSWAASSPIRKYEDLHSSSLPDMDAKSLYAVDLATVMSKFIQFESLGIKFKKGPPRTSWIDICPLISFGFSLASIAVLVGQPRVVSPSNCSYLNERLDSYMVGLGALAGKPDQSSEEFVMEGADVVFRTNQMIDVVVQRAGATYSRKNRDPLIRTMRITSEAAGGFAAIESLWPYVSSESKREIFRPLTQGAT